MAVPDVSGQVGSYVSVFEAYFKYLLTGPGFGWIVMGIVAVAVLAYIIKRG